MTRAIMKFPAGLLLLTLSSAAFAQAANLPAGELVSRIQSAAQTMSFSGTYVHQQDSTLHTLRIVQSKDAKGMVTKVQALDGRRQEIIRTNSETRIYSPDRQAVKLDQSRSLRPAFPGMFLGKPENALRYYDLSVGADMRIADIDAVEVNLKPKDDQRWPIRMWVDKRTSLMMKCQKLNRDGSVIEQVAFSDFSTAAKGNQTVSLPSFQGARDWPVSDESMVALSPMPRLKFKPEAARGFELIAVYQRAGQDTQPFSLRRYVLTDGVATISVFVQPKRTSNALTDQVSSRGALSMMSKMIQDSWVTVMGEVPPETLRQFASSLEWK